MCSVFDKEFLKLTNRSSLTEGFNAVANEQFTSLINEIDIVRGILVSIDGPLETLSDEQVERLSLMFKRQIVIVFESSFNKTCLVLWKQAKWTQMVMVEMLNQSLVDDLSKVTTFVKDFIIKSLADGHSGLVGEFNTCEIKKYSVEFSSLADKDGRDMLMLSAKYGNSKAVEYFLKLNFNVNRMIKGDYASNLAYENTHFEIVAALLKSDSFYPQNFSVDNISDDFKDIIKDMTKLHKNIIKDNEKDVEKILKKYSNLKHYFDVNNESAVAKALKRKSFRSYKVLLENNACVGPTEKRDKILETMKREDLNKISKIHLDKKINLTDSTIMTLMVNSSLGHDIAGIDEKQSYVAKAFHELFYTKLIGMILKIVASARNFNIVFDFKRKHVQYADARSPSYVSGVFHLSGQIYIAAANYFDNKTFRSIIGTLAHELCHFAMVLTYANDGSPYAKGDEDSKQKFDEILEECKGKKGIEPIVDRVFGMEGKEAYEESNYHAELIVRVVQIIAQYGENSEKVKELREVFKKLFDYFEDKCMKDMENELPAIKAKALEEYERNARKVERKISNLKKICIGLFIVGVACSIGTYKYYYKQSYQYDNLEKDDQNKLNESFVSFYGEPVKLYELIAEENYFRLYSEDIEQILKGTHVDVKYMKLYVKFNWTTSPDNLKLKVLSTVINFRGNRIKLQSIASINSTSLQLLDSTDIINILDGNFIIEMQSIDQPKFYNNRFFIKTSIPPFHFDAITMSYHRSKNAKIFTKLIDELIEKRILILSDYAGTGKTATMRNSTVELQKHFYDKYVVYIEIKNCYEGLKSFEKTRDLGTFIADKILHLPNFEREFFKELFAKNRVIFLWDAVDELFSMKNVILELLKLINEETKSYQIISTRCQYADKLLKKTKATQAFKLIPYETDEQEIFIKTFLRLLQTDESLIQSAYKRVEGFIKRNNDYVRTTGGYISTPLILQMFSKIAIYKSKDGNSFCDCDHEIFMNPYRLYKCFEETKEFDRLRLQTLRSYYHFYAVEVLTLSSNYEKKSQIMQAMKQKFDELLDWNLDLVTLEGIFYENSHGRKEFAHRTFAEFYLADYLITRLYITTATVRQEEIQLRIDLLFFVMTDSFSHYTRKVIDSFLKFEQKGECQLSEEIDKVIKENFSQQLKKLKYSRTKHEVEQFERIKEFFKCDKSIKKLFDEI